MKNNTIRASFMIFCLTAVTSSVFSMEEKPEKINSEKRVDVASLASVPPKEGFVMNDNETMEEYEKRLFSELLKRRPKVAEVFENNFPGFQKLVEDNRRVQLAIEQRPSLMRSLYDAYVKNSNATKEAVYNLNSFNFEELNLAFDDKLDELLNSIK